MAAPAAAAEIPVLAYVTVGLLALLAWAVLRGLRSTWLYTFGYILDQLAGIPIPIPFHTLHPFGFLERVNREVLNALEAGASRSEHAVGYLFHGAAVIQGWIAKELFHLAADVWGWATWLQRSHLPIWVKAVIYAAVPPLVLPLIARALSGVHPTHLTRVIAQRIGLTRSQVKALIAAALAGAGAIALPLPHVLPRLKRLEREALHEGKRLRRLERLLGATGAALLVARALGLGSIRCLRDGNIGRAARAFCGLDQAIVDGLLAGLVVLEIPFSIEELASEFLAVEDQLVGLVAGAISELDGLA